MNMDKRTLLNRLNVSVTELEQNLNDLRNLSDYTQKGNQNNQNQNRQYSVQLVNIIKDIGFNVSSINQFLYNKNNKNNGCDDKNREISISYNTVAQKGSKIS